MDTFLSPASRKNNPGPYRRLEETVVDGFDVSDLSQQTNLQLTDRVRIWGFREGSKPYWEQMENGDAILFYTGDEYEFAARIQAKEQNEELAKELWGRLENSLGGDLMDDFEPWPYLVYLYNLRKLSLHSSQLHDLLGFKQNHIVGTIPVKSERMDRVNEEYGSMGRLIVEHTVKKYYDSDYPSEGSQS